MQHVAAGVGGYGLGSNGYTSVFREYPTSVQDQILSGFRTYAHVTDEVYMDVPYVCPDNAPFKDYHVLINDCNHVSIRRNERPMRDLKPGRDGRVCISFGDRDDIRHKRQVSVRKLAIAFVHPDLCMRQFGCDMFNDNGQSCGMIRIMQGDGVPFTSWYLMSAHQTGPVAARLLTQCL